MSDGGERLSARLEQRGAVSANRFVAAIEAAQPIGAPHPVADLTMRRRLRPPSSIAKRRMKNLAERRKSRR